MLSVCTHTGGADGSFSSEGETGSAGGREFGIASFPMVHTGVVSLQQHPEIVGPLPLSVTPSGMEQQQPSHSAIATDVPTPANEKASTKISMRIRAFT